MKRGDWQFEYTKIRLRDGIFVPHREIEAFVKALDEEPAAPPPERIVVSEKADKAYRDACGGIFADEEYAENRARGLRAAFKIMLRENLERMTTDAVLRLQNQIAIGGTRTGLYRELMGEPWPE